jgi:methionine synthase II (cobalamin-independent)
MPRTEPPFRADHVGSLPRPERLLKALRQIVDVAEEVWG